MVVLPHELPYAETPIKIYLRKREKSDARDDVSQPVRRRPARGQRLHAGDVIQPYRLVEHHQRSE